MNIKYEETGEKRPPYAGEWFKNSRGWAEQARFDFSATSFPIMKQIIIYDDSEGPCLTTNK